MKRILTLLLIVINLAAHGQKKNLAQTPPMGWNSWNYFGKPNVSEQLIVEVIDAIVANGLKEAGYNYVVVDGGWRDTALDAKGRLVANSKFPRGMKFLADYAHSKGLKFGLHIVPGSHDCGGDKVGGWGKEAVQMQQFNEWGIDFIKLDRCKFSLIENPDKRKKRSPQWYAGWRDTANLYKAYSTWAKLIKENERDILYSASVYKFYDWYPQLTNMGRTTGDINANCSGGATFDDPDSKPHLSVMTIADRNNKWAAYAQPGYWNDPDMMVTGNKGLNIAQQKAHFALWCIMSSPLFLGNDPRNMSPEEKAIITNRDAIAVNQDATEQGIKIKKDGPAEIWAKRLKNGGYGVLLLNRDAKQTHKITLKAADLKIEDAKKIRDIYNKKELGSFNDFYQADVPPQSGLFLLIY
ncbi:glycoside hydrolase family 27 protein [Niabella insulamsoli]|uniref:glycoside hydrolase family 27 protein n=1 Tax=Niabella insulamsoli TaxID=3144874 RepID=UPI0031FD1753